MRGAIVGSLVLVIAYVGLQPGVAGKAAAGGGVITALLRRAMSPDVAGIPNRAGFKGGGQSALSPANPHSPVSPLNPLNPLNPLSPFAPGSPLNPLHPPV